VAEASVLQGECACSGVARRCERILSGARAHVPPRPALVCVVSWWCMLVLSLKPSFEVSANESLNCFITPRCKRAWWAGLVARAGSVHACRWARKVHPHIRWVIEGCPH
jgi:hypothetical protein